MAPDQCRKARGLLRWSQRDLAAAADVPLWFVIAFEDGDSPAVMAGHEVDLREALEAAGIKFDGDEVTLASRGPGGVN
jgi:predicted transcriptional regulator